MAPPGSIRAESISVAIDGMTETLGHRGPDDSGTWQDAKSGIALGHRRLSIIDLTAAGAQPMVSRAGRYILTYNGEIYNATHISRELAATGERFLGHSDTEVMLAAIERWGLDATLPKLNGMFAFALWDRQERSLRLVRDRLGEKPLYYGWAGNTLLFGSEIRALRAYPGFRSEIDRDVLTMYFRYSCVPTPHCIYKRIYKLPPGTVLTISSRTRGSQSPVPYWSALVAAEEGLGNLICGSPTDLADQLEHLLSDAVALRMRADVDLGAFLSGGIDSSTVIALMQNRASRAVQTFTIGFDDPNYDESSHAGAIARHLGTDHTSLIVTPRDAMDVIPRLPTLYDEPFADSSQIPTVLVNELARRSVKVVLSGDGGDELFAGYNRHSWCVPIWQRIARVPPKVRRATAPILGTLPPGLWDALFRRIDPLLPDRLRVRNAGIKVQKIARVLPSQDIDDMYLRLTSSWQRPAALVLNGRELEPSISERLDWRRTDHPIERMMLLDLVTYLPDDILVKLDRASMAVGLEARVPLLDHRIVEFACRVPLEFKLRDGEAKWLLRQVLYRHVPRQLVDRPKAGFALPVGRWLRGPLRDWAEVLLEPARVRNEGYLRPKVVRDIWNSHLAGRRDHGEQLWSVLMFQAWLEQTASPSLCISRHT